MKRGFWFALAAVVALSAGVTLIALPRSAEWTCASDEALREFEAAMEAQTKLYKKEARLHLENALELDPDFVMAKLQLLEHSHGDDHDRIEKLVEEALASDLDRLNTRERFMIERMKLYRAKRYDEATAVLDAYLEQYPDDPWVLYEKATELWVRQENDAAERVYLKLLEVAPNWVIAYNQLGYITMLQGRFAEAEEYFTSYRFIAPDQANPHDSLGELFIILGRFDEAVLSLERALEIKPDFFASYEHLLLAYELMEDRAGVARIISRAAEHVPSIVGRMQCSARAYELAADGAWADLVESAGEECVEGEKHSRDAIFLTHLAACKLAEWELAESLHERMQPQKSSSSESTMEMDAISAVAQSAEGIRLGLQGDIDEAIARFEAADEKMTYLNCGLAVFKLHNRLLLVEGLRAAGREAEARKLLGKVMEVNPSMAEGFREKGMQIAGFER